MSESDAAVVREALTDERLSEMEDWPEGQVPDYWPFDQDVKLPPDGWRSDLPELVEWEKWHGHDVRLKCYPEFGCQAVAYESSRMVHEIRRLRALLAAADDRCVMSPTCVFGTRDE